MNYMYVKQSDNTVWHIAQIRPLHPSVSIPDGADIEFLGYLPLVPTPSPEPLLWNTVEEMPPVNNVQTWAQVPMTNDQIKQVLIAVVDSHLNSVAQANGYDNIVSACSYAAVENPFQIESQKFIVWRADIWTYCYALMQQVFSGAVAAPTEAELIAGLPAFTL